MPKSLDGEPVVLAYVYGYNVTHSWHRSVVELIGWDMVNGGGKVMQGGFVAMHCGTGGLVEARNKAVRTFLDERKADWLFWVDTDMGFAPDTLDRLMEVADPVKRPIVGALCFSQREVEPDGLGGFIVAPAPTVFDWTHVGEQMGFSVRWDYPRDTVTQVAGTGSACILIHRSAFEKVAEKFGPVWYDRVPNTTTGQIFSEDLSFCMRANAAGVPIFVHTGVKTNHQKLVWVDERTYWQQRALSLKKTPDLPVHVDIAASLETVARGEHVRDDGMLKLDADLDRYARILDATKPEVLVETGTNTGASAKWFAERGVDVITVDRNPVTVDHPRVTVITGDSADPQIAAKVAEIVAGRRCMVSLDSDHSGPHVTREIELYGPLVSPGCYLVVEDGIFGYAPQGLREAHSMGDMDGSPLDAIAAKLADSPDWSRDVAVERMHPVTHHPAGWWVRHG